ncbi:hypothetical protein [Catenovulum adriaticum]|uniref:Helix-turn-helix protein n=1 Tax=Catenovulum adriaticum TaxID=2984846 RepID=A0ABY7AJK6_9ALTE|nr:hypothetical protein [Catenovulum sp. TS8]WAJ69753.1 hypothetical protein OLW01_11395 [Catenovulum sp. TS8]
MSKKNKKPHQVNYYSLINGGVAVLPNAVLENYRYLKLTPCAKVLLNYLAAQYRGYNNGDLCATLSILRKKGFNSQDTITRSIKMLEEQELIVRTKQGGKHYRTGQNLPNLYAIAWQPIDECGGKLDVMPTIKPHINFLAEYKNVA